MRISFKSFTLVVLWAFPMVGMSQTVATVKSPDQNITVHLNLDNGSLFYEAFYETTPFLEKSPLGLQTSLSDFSQNLVYISSSTKSINESYELQKAKVSHVNYHANALSSIFTNSKQDTLLVHFQLSNRDIGFSYEIRSKEGRSNIKIYKETTGFNIPDQATTYITPQALPMTGWMETKPSYEEPYTLNEAVGTPSANGVGYTFPALFKLDQDKGWLLISETGVDGQYPGARLGEATKDGLYPLEFPQQGENSGIGDTFAAQPLPAKTPWRTITLGNSLKPIVESTVAFDLVKPKYEASTDYKMGRATWSWIVWQDNSINYQDQITYIDMAAELNFEYVLIDNWWDTRIGREKVEELVQYANKKGVDVILWYNSNGYWSEAPQGPKNKMNSIIDRQKEMQWLQSIGVKGLKVDFFGGDKQTTMQLYEAILNDANNYGLGITFHGCTLPRGWERMYPNFVTSEAVLASENLVFNQRSLDHHALNASILPFTRNPVAAMDFAPVFLNHRLSKDQNSGTIRKTTDAFELATAILYLSPIQHFGLTPNNLKEQPEFVLDFIKEVPSVWDQTLYIGGAPEDYAAIARRKANKWYVALVNGTNTKRKIKLQLPMLAGKNVQVIQDKDPSSFTSELIHKKVTKKGDLTIQINGQGGAVIMGQD